MAWSYVAVHLSLPSLPHFPIHMEKRLNKATTFACSSPRLKKTSCTGISSSPISSSITQNLLSVRLIGVHHTYSPVAVSFFSNRVHCSRTLSGYWVGPDSEDGWGFVQALVDEII